MIVVQIIQDEGRDNYYYRGGADDGSDVGGNVSGEEEVEETHYGTSPDSDHSRCL